MVRGKKNFLPPSYLVYGFGFIFKVSITLQINESVHTMCKARVHRQNIGIRGATKRIYNLKNQKEDITWKFFFSDNVHIGNLIILAGRR